MKKNGHLICSVQPKSIAANLEIEAGDKLLSIDGNEVADVFDYRMQIAEDELEVLIRKKDGEEWLFEIEKDPDEDLGLRFESSLMDETRSCRNHCVFCFIDQMPPGMRKTLYFKDDDSRLSFLQGNYITLTNMSDADIARVIRYHMEPVNISFHATEPSLRAKMLGNRHAGEIFPKVQALADAGIAMNGQIVLCRGWNDGEALERTITDLSAYLPALRSVSVVPVGLTKYRRGLADLQPFNAEDAKQLLSQITARQDEMLAKKGTRFVYASDEWYLLAGRELPEEEEYEGYPQLENGVGMLRLLISETREALRENEDIQGADASEKLTLVTGVLAAPCMREIAREIACACPQKTIHVQPIRNDFFGETITVSGLVTGRDLIGQLKGAEPCDRLLIPCNMLRAGEEVFLDDVRVRDVENELRLPVTVVGKSGEDLVRAVCGLRQSGNTTERQNYEQTSSGDRGPAECR